MLMVGGVLYMWVRNAAHARLAWSRDRGRTWQWCDWRFTTSFGCPTFLNYWIIGLLLTGGTAVLRLLVRPPSCRPGRICKTCSEEEGVLHVSSSLFPRCNRSFPSCPPKVTCSGRLLRPFPEKDLYGMVFAFRDPGVIFTSDQRNALMTPTEATESLSLREVFLQLNRRLELIEDDARQFHRGQSAQFARVHTRIDQLDERLSARIDQLDERLSARIDQLDRKIDHRFNWIVGILLTGGTAVLGLLVRLSLQ